MTDRTYFWGHVIGLSYHLFVKITREAGPFSPQSCNSNFSVTDSRSLPVKSFKIKEMACNFRLVAISLLIVIDEIQFYEISQIHFLISYRKISIDIYLYAKVDRAVTGYSTNVIDSSWDNLRIRFRKGFSKL